MSKDTAKEKKPFNKKKLKYGAAATIITIFVIAIVVVINLIAGILTEKKGFKLDLTSQKYYDVSQETIDYVKNIDVDVDIAVMAKKADLEGNTYNKMVVETLAKYEQNSDRIKVNYYDIAENPDVVSKYASSYNGEIKEGNIIIANGDRVKVTSLTNLFTIDTSNYYQTGTYSYSSYKGEQEITSALMSVTDANPVKAAIIAKYNGEAIYPSDLGYAISSLVQMLDKNGYEYELIDLLSDDLSTDEYDLAILPAPMNDLTDDGIKKLEDFLYNNGNLDKNMIYIADILQRKTPKIDEFLEVWGISVEGNQVIESSADKIQQVNVARNTYGLTKPAKAPVVTVSDSSYSEGLSNTKLPIVAPAARNIKLLFDANVDRTTTALLKSSESSLLYPLNLQEAGNTTINSLNEDTNEAAEESEDNSEVREETQQTTEFDAENAQKGENVVMALASKFNTDSDNVTHTNNILVIGGASFTDPCITGEASFNNAEFVLNTVNKICGKENGIIIAEKNFESPAVTVTASQLSVISKVVVLVIPLIVLICGVVVFIRRKNR